MLPTNLASILPTADEFYEFARGQMAWITNCLSDGDHDCWTPQLMVQVFDPKEGKSLEVMSLHVPFNTDAEKHWVMSSIASELLARQKIPVMACLSAECWTSRNPPKGMRPADDPFRTEGVVLFGMTVNRLHCVANAPILRPAGKIVPTEFGELRTENVTTQLLEILFGAFFQLFRASIGHQPQHASN